MVEPKKFVDFTEFTQYLLKFKNPEIKIKKCILIYGQMYCMIDDAPNKLGPRQFNPPSIVYKYYLKKYGSVVLINEILYKISKNSKDYLILDPV